jgi:hypothetical protein
MHVIAGAGKGRLCVLYVRAVPDGGSRVRGGPLHFSAVRLQYFAPSLAATRSASDVSTLVDRKKRLVISLIKTGLDQPLVVYLSVRSLCHVAGVAGTLSCTARTLR